MNQRSTTLNVDASPTASACSTYLPPKARIPRLDFLRALSAGIVVIYHSGYGAIPAGFGVLTFFVISGFLITHLLLREKEATGTISFRGFYLRRSLRIFPPFYVYWVVAVALLSLRHAKILWPQAICSLFYVSNYYQGLHNYPSTPFSHTWSLSVEEQFYLLWPAAFVLFRNRLHSLARGLLFLIPSLWIYRSFLYFRGVSDPYIYTSFETRIDAILVGCLFAILIHLGIASRLLAELRRPRYLPITIAALLLSVIGGGHIGLGYRDVVGFALDPVLLILLILQLIETPGAGWMDTRAIVYLGGISYSTYLYQQLVIPAVSRLLHAYPQPVISAGCLIGTWLVASVSFELIEKPFLKIKEWVTRTPPAQAVRAIKLEPALESPLPVDTL
jgi:peptidoglycan/LPS O-acetylase OafA/YrhL